jgi:hypothetical protein
MKHLLDNEIISPTQYAFRPNSSTTLALQTIINNIHKHATARKPTLAIYIDLSKAYDTILHSKLLHKLKHEFNFTDDTIAFIKSYFTNRKQSTHTQHAQSKTQTITHGIPQGSTLSTTFFLLYINNIIQTVPNSKVYTYADDTTLVITAETTTDLQQLAQTELNNLINYFQDNNLVPNPTKTNYTIFYPPKANLQLNINTTELSQNPNSKLLGVIVEEKFKHHHTITNIIKKLQPTIHMLRHATKALPAYKMKHIYYMHAFPHLIGAITVWGTNDRTKTYIDPIIKAQKKILRIIKNLPPRSHTKPIMTELKILNVFNLYILRVCLEMHPFIYPTKQTHRPEHDHNYISATQIHEYPTRYAQQLHQHIPNKYRYTKTTNSPNMENYTKINSNIWNTLPQQLKENRSLSSFKKALRTYLQEQQDKDTRSYP